MLKSKANWSFYKKKSDGDSAFATNMIDGLLSQRAINTVEEKQAFLHPSLEDLQDPSAFHQIDQAKERILNAIETGESIMIYGDYDADGITSTALLMQVFIELGANSDYYIPNRFKEGYGLNKDSILEFHENGVTLLITVDNGIANADEVNYANSLGMDVIITDHHEMQDTIPEAYAIIHPKLSTQYIWKELAGVGVAFQLAHHLLEEPPVHLLDLVAIGTIADMVPLLEENRILAYYGLKALQQTENIGIQALKDVCKPDKGKAWTERDIGFMLAPRLNAVGRLEDASLAVELLLTMDPVEAEAIASKVEELNSERQQIVKKIVEEAEQKVNPKDGVIILYDTSWHEGVLGIAASRLVRKFDRPVIMLTHKQDSNELKGSARSIPAFDIFQSGMTFREYFTQFGGHAQAAGMTFSFDQLEAVRSKFNEVIFSKLSEADFKQEIHGIQSIHLEELNESFVEQIQMLSPFGMGNEEPIFHVTGHPLQMRKLGQHEQHLKLQFRKDKHALDVIGFQFGGLAPFISKEAEVSVVGTLGINEWNGNRMVQMMLQDIAVNQWQLFDFRARQQERNILPFIQQFKRSVLLGQSREYLQKLAVSQENVQIITYDDLQEELEPVDMLFICELPPTMVALEEKMTQLKPRNIHVNYSITEDAFLQSIPNREDFKWLYGYIKSYEPVQLKVDLPKIMQGKRWTKEKTIFMLKVFIDLKFIRVASNTIYVEEIVGKAPLHTSKTYQQHLEQSEIEKLLYYSTFSTLKEWFENYINTEDMPREEVTNGF